MDGELDKECYEYGGGSPGDEEISEPTVGWWESKIRAQISRYE